MLLLSCRPRESKCGIIGTSEVLSMQPRIKISLTLDGIVTMHKDQCFSKLIGKYMKCLKKIAPPKFQPLIGMVDTNRSILYLGIEMRHHKDLITFFGTHPATCNPTRALNLYHAATWGISSSRKGSNDTLWNIWAEFCHCQSCDPFSNVEARTVESALCAIGQTFTSLGYTDPHLQSLGKFNLCLH
jgi:hypothetical protein